MRVRDGFVVREIADNIFIVPTLELVKDYKMMTINKSAKFVWDLLENEMTEEELIHKLMEKYGIDEQVARKDVDNFLNYLREKKVLIEE